MPKKQDCSKKKAGGKRQSKKQRKDQIPDLPEQMTSHDDGKQLLQGDLVESSDEDEMLAVHIAVPEDHLDTPVTSRETALQDGDEVTLEQADDMDTDGESADAEEIEGAEELVRGNVPDANVDSTEPDPPDEGGTADPSADEQPGMEAGTETDDSGGGSSSQSSSDSDSPVRRVLTRERKKTKIFTCNEDGNLQWQDR